MPLKLTGMLPALLFLLTLAGAMLPETASAASCKTQSQLTVAERDALSSAARTMVAEVQSGDTQALRANTIPAVAADFSGIAGSADTLKPFVQQASITVDSLYALDATAESVGAARTDFYCGSPVVVMNFTDLPPAMYALAILHATGVPQPQEIALILSETAEHRWMLGGFFSKPMMEASHDGLWYWVSARNYAQKNMRWDAWFYYRMAANILNPVEFLSSPNLEKLKQEQGSVHPVGLPDAQPLMVDAHGSVFRVTSIDTTTALGTLDLEVHYAPDIAEATELHNPPTARKQVTELMTALLAMHPELNDGFHGFWVQADQGPGSASLFSLELPMNQIVPQTQLTVTIPPLATQ
jgi:hypothetical protein